jgi:hypothetical protein
MSNTNGTRQRGALLWLRLCQRVCNPKSFSSGHGLRYPHARCYLYEHLLRWGRRGVCTVMGADAVALSRLLRALASLGVHAEPLP